ncbi:MAG TPA: condensation domain-containing protein, partial [Thermoanaerobaculia bacterium]|nr:condensation domain-containing protein [Thermoanaerobaculia bacterium]
MNDFAYTLATLSPEKREVLETLLVEGNADLGAWPLSFAQQRLWFLDRLQPGAALYNMPAAVRLRGALDRPALERALAEVVRRHEALRTTFVAVNGRPFQVVSPEAAVDLPLTDLSVLP